MEQGEHHRGQPQPEGDQRDGGGSEPGCPPETSNGMAQVPPGSAKTKTSGAPRTGGSNTLMPNPFQIAELTTGHLFRFIERLHKRCRDAGVTMLGLVPSLVAAWRASPARGGWKS